MKKLHSFAFYAFVTPVITLGASSLLAQESTDYGSDREQQGAQREQGANQSSPLVTEDGQSNRSAGQPGSQAAGRSSAHDQSLSQSSGYLNAVPANGMHASSLIGAEVSTPGDEDVGEISDLIIDENGQIVAIVVGVGGFLGMGERDVAIGWDDVTRSGIADDQELQIDVTREELGAAPEFESAD